MALASPIAVCARMPVCRLTAASSACRCLSESGIERRFRSTLDHFRNSGYDRGHMAPAANHKRSQEAMDQTFILSNTSPQASDDQHLCSCSSSLTDASCLPTLSLPFTRSPQTHTPGHLRTHSAV